MGKDPAFLFYPGDWLGGTMGMNFEMKGMYIELLILQFNTGGFTEDEAKQVLSVRFDYAWATLQRKFTFINGLYINTRLATEIEKRTKFIESRRLSGLTPKKQKAYAKHTHKRTEDENRNEYKDIIEVYNNTVFAKIQKLTELRKKHLQARLTEHGNQIVVDTILKASKSDFLRGVNERGWRADFDWLMNPNNFMKVLEGKFDNRIPEKEIPKFSSGSND